MICRKTLHLLPSEIKRLHRLLDVQHSPTPQLEVDSQRLCTLPLTIAIVMTTIISRMVFPTDVFIFFNSNASDALIQLLMICLAKTLSFILHVVIETKQITLRHALKTCVFNNFVHAYTHANRHLKRLFISVVRND